MSDGCGGAEDKIMDCICRVPDNCMVRVVYNRPGLSAIDYRCGTHGQFMRAMVALLSSSKYPELRGLTTRDGDDFAIALLDAWAMVADVLTFYQERIASESYLDTATERLSVLKLARLIGYELSPGVAADTYLSFMVENPPGLYPQSFPQLPGTYPPESVLVPIEKGIKVQSIPDPGENPLAYETVEAILARAEWNALKVRLTLPQTLSPDMECVYAKGISLSVKPGDRLLLVKGAGDDEKALLDVTGVKTYTDSGSTRIDVKLISRNGQVAFVIGNILMPIQASIEIFKDTESLTDSEITKFQASALDGMAVKTLASVKKWPVDVMAKALITRNFSMAAIPEGAGVYLMGLRAALFGHNAPKYDSLPQIMGKDSKGDSVVVYSYPDPWGNDITIENDGGRADKSFYVYLDGVYSSIAKGSYIVLKTPGNYHTCRVEDITEITRNDYTLIAKVTRLLISPNDYNAVKGFKLKETEVLAQGIPLEVAEVPITDAVGPESGSIPLDGPYIDLKVGQKAVLTGKRLDLQGVVSSELITIKDIQLAGGYTTLFLQAPLKYSYARDLVTINANVAYATHGEATAELLGDGDAGQAFQRFALLQGPLTYVKSSGGGTHPVLEVSVNDTLWREVETLYSAGPDDHVYALRNEDDGRTIIEFGDGIMGARLPTGSGNVRASYRKGIGMAGMVKAGRLKMLMTRPAGVKDVDNPLDSCLGADKESAGDARGNVPLKALTLGRVVSLQDYEDFARATPGIAKALATWTWDGEHRGVYITIAGPGGAIVMPDDPVYVGLLESLRNSGDPYVHVSLGKYGPVFFKLSATVTLDPSVPSDIRAGVKDRIIEALTDTFAFDARAFGQPVALSEVEATIQAVPGVAMVDVDVLSANGQDGLSEPLAARRPEMGDTKMGLAELLAIDVNALKVEVKP